jgi:Exo70 exocyst complex subunit
MDALLSQQGEWRVSSSLLREILGTELLQKILPLYKDFFNKYSKVQFSKKHMGEYLRFPPEDVERLLKNFFGKT